MRKFVFFIMLFIVSSCSGVDNGFLVSSIGEDENEVQDAGLLRIAQREGYRVMEITNPWDTTRLLNRYIMVDKNATLPSELPEGIIVRTPVSRVICYTSVDIGAMNTLGALDKLVGVCDADYIVSLEVKEALKNGEVKNLGTYNKPNMEQVLASDADLIIVSPFEGKDYGLVAQLGVPIAECASYLERSPLGRSEWIKFYAEFTADMSSANKLYAEIRENYMNTVSYIAHNAHTKPSILPDKRYGQVWYVASGGSYAAQLYKDAGASYAWADDTSVATIALSFEEVYATCHDADVWVFTYAQPNDMNLTDLKREYDSYALFSAYKNKAIYACNSAKIPFYELSPLHPDKVLSDIAKMLHPELFKDVEFNYYSKLE